MMLRSGEEVPEYEANASRVVLIEMPARESYGEGYQDVQNRRPSISNTQADLERWKPKGDLAAVLSRMFDAYGDEVAEARGLIDEASNCGTWPCSLACSRSTSIRTAARARAYQT